MTYIPPANTSVSIAWPSNYGCINASSMVQFGHHCLMYNPLIAVNKNINMIAVVSSGMFYKRYLNNTSSIYNTLQAFKGDGMTLINSFYSNVVSYHSQDLLYYIKDGYTVTKREKIFQQTRSAGEIGSYEYGTSNYNILGNSDGSPIVHSISIIAIGCYFVLCGYNH